MASKAATALTGAGVGAGVGTAIFPGVGTVVGAGLGALGGYFLGDDPADAAGTSYAPNRDNFRLGLGPQGGYADTQAQHYKERQFGLDTQRDAAQTRTGPTQRMPGSIDLKTSDGQAYLRDADAESRRLQLQALGGIQSQTSALNDFAHSSEGPSAAQAQLQAGTDAAARQQFGFARSQPGGGGAALRSAAFNAAGISANAANTAAMLRAQETQAFRAQQLQALGAAQQGAGLSAGLTGQVRGADQGFATTKAGQANTDAAAQNAFNQGQQQLQFNVGQNNLNAGLQTQQQNDAYTLGLTGASQGYDALTNTVANANTAQGNAFESATAQGAGLGVQNKSVDNAQSNAETGMALGAVQGGLTAYAQSQAGKPAVSSGGSQTTSDVRAKTDIKRADVLRALSGGRPEYPTVSQPDLAGLDAAYARSAHPNAEPSRLPSRASFPDAGPDLRPAQGYEYAYKDPQQHGEGRFVGPMAQDLEHIPGVVEPDQSGTKTINAPRLTLANTAAVSEQQKRIDRLEQIAALQGQDATEYPRLAPSTRFAPAAGNVTSDERRKTELRALGGDAEVFQPIIFPKPKPQQPKPKAREA